VDHVIEVGGRGTIEQSLKCVKLEGLISLVGFLGGVDPKNQPTILETLGHICTVRGVYVGSKALMIDMIRAIEANDIHPVVDEKVFTLDKAREAYEYMVSCYRFVRSGYLLTECDTVRPKALRQVGYQDQLNGVGIFLTFSYVTNSVRHSFN
jgi:D-arabinose 1-dehydrogenase-like Zn-dependent alcohol dehydrogenase